MVHVRDSVLQQYERLRVAACTRRHMRIWLFARVRVNVTQIPDTFQGILARDSHSFPWIVRNVSSDRDTHGERRRPLSYRVLRPWSRDIRRVPLRNTDCEIDYGRIRMLGANCMTLLNYSSTGRAGESASRKSRIRGNVCLMYAIRSRETGMEARAHVSKFNIKGRAFIFIFVVYRILLIDRRLKFNPPNFTRERIRKNVNATRKIEIHKQNYRNETEIKREKSNTWRCIYKHRPSRE